MIRAEYHGSFPAIGIRYASDDTPDLSPLVEESVERALGSTPVMSLVSFLGASEVDWSAVAAPFVSQKR